MVVQIIRLQLLMDTMQLCFRQEPSRCCPMDVCLAQSTLFVGRRSTQKPAAVTYKAALTMVGAQYAVQLGKEGFKVNLVSPVFRSTNLDGFHEYGGNPSEVAVIACNFVVDTKMDGPNGTFHVA